MKFSEVFERSGIVTDEKARRVLNTSDREANITAGEVEDGVTIERLEGIGVPVFRYNTQITIHGRLPGFSAAARPAGFKAVFKNDNGTVGVKYVAVDGAKKQIIRHASLYGTRGWIAHINSEGLTLSRHFETREECIAAYKAFPRDLFYGGTIAGASPLGGFYVYAHVSAIPEANVWPLIGRLWGVGSQAQIDAEEAKRTEERKARDAQWRLDSAKREADLAAKRRAKADAMTLPKLETVQRREGAFVRISRGMLGEVRPQLYTVKKRGACLCYAIQDFPSSQTPTKWTKVESRVWESVDRDAEQGFVFAAR